MFSSRPGFCWCWHCGPLLSKQPSLTSRCGWVKKKNKLESHVISKGHWGSLQMKKLVYWYIFRFFMRKTRKLCKSPVPVVDILGGILVVQVVVLFCNYKNMKSNETNLLTILLATYISCVCKASHHGEVSHPTAVFPLNCLFNFLDGLK